MPSLRNMRLTKKEKTERKKEYAITAPMIEEYPWGLRVELNKDSMKKLGIKAGDYKAGSKTPFSGMAIIEVVSSTDTTKGVDESMTLQITHLALEAKGKDA